MIYSEVLSDDEVNQSIEKCRTSIRKVAQLKSAAYVASLTTREFIECEKDICETPEVKGVTAIMCLIYEGLLCIVSSIQSDLNFM